MTQRSQWDYWLYFGSYIRSNKYHHGNESSVCQSKLFNISSFVAGLPSCLEYFCEIIINKLAFRNNRHRTLSGMGIQVSISLTFYEQLFCSKVLFAAFLTVCVWLFFSKRNWQKSLIVKRCSKCDSRLTSRRGSLRRTSCGWSSGTRTKLFSRTTHSSPATRWATSTSKGKCQ